MLLLAICGLAFATSAVFADPIADRAGPDEGQRQGDRAASRRSSRARSISTPRWCMDALTKLAERCAEDRRRPRCARPAARRAAIRPPSPEIWEDMAGFQAAIDKFKADTAAAVAAAPADLEALEGAVRRDRFELRQLPRDLPHQEGLIASPMGMRGQARRRRRCWPAASAAAGVLGC